MNRAGKGESVKKATDKYEGARRKLTEMRRNLISESKAEIGQILSDADKYNGVSDDGDWADVAFRDSMQAAKLTRHQLQLKAIEEALSRIDEGTYGNCVDCDEEIPAGRLNAMPFALRCVECQQNYEVMRSEKEETAGPAVPPSAMNDAEVED